MSWKTSFLLLALAIAACKEAPKPAPVPEPSPDTYAHPEALIEASELQEALGVAGIRLVDFRKQSAYAAGHIPGAVNLWRPDIEDPNGEVPGLAAPAAAVEALLSRSGISATDTLIIYDDEAGCNAARLWWVLQYYGYTKIRLLNGGIQAWEAKGFGLDQTIRSNAPTHFNLEVNEDAWVDVDGVQQGLHDRYLLLIDARARERFDGINEPIDPVAGHIPGSVNLPSTDNLDASGHFLPAEQVHAQYRAVLGEFRPEQSVHSCGSGVFACFGVLAMEYAGLPGSKIYPGSWSEWIRDPSRPISVSP